MIRTFYLNREQDISGISGIGRVAEGCVFNDGQVVLKWECGNHSSINIYKSLQDMEYVHSHGGKTKVIFNA